MDERTGKLDKSPRLLLTWQFGDTGREGREAAPQASPEIIKMLWEGETYSSGAAVL
jgi:hypothetical protein